MSACDVDVDKPIRKLCGMVTCSNCPWLRSSTPGEFPRERYIALRSSVRQGFEPMFACHKSKDGEAFACVGYILRGGLANFNTRFLIAKLGIDPEKLRATGPLYDCYSEMARANGVPEELLKEIAYDERQFVIDEEKP